VNDQGIIRRSCSRAVILAAAAMGLAGCEQGGFFCGGNDGMCGWTSEDLARVEALSGTPAAPSDTSNMYVGNQLAEELGKQFYYDTRFSGPSNWQDGLGRVMPFGRTAIGTSAGVGCITCHDPGHGGADPASSPGDVSMGAGWTYANGLTTYNAQYYDFHLWNGRLDSLWAQAVADNENALTTNGNRLKTAWLLNDFYATAYQGVFTDPLPMSATSPTTSASVQATVESTGQCTLAGGTCPSTCRSVTSTTDATVTGCWPRFPLQGKPGKKAGCQTGDATEPFGDAYDCMDPADQKAITHVLVNFGKAIAAYEETLTLPPAPFDAWVTELMAGHGSSSTAISGDAKAGALLFVGKAGCSDCHNTVLFSDNKFHNVGVGQMGMGVPTVADCPAGGVCDCASATPKNCLPNGASDGLQKLEANGFRRDSMWSDDPLNPAWADEANLDPSTRPVGAYRTPSLRNVTLTPPYMHDGSLATLGDVVWHYTQGIVDQSTPGPAAASFRPLYLSTDEQAQLVAFLESLESGPPPSTATPPTIPTSN
jgi:cytochrome c peroxidase